MNRTTKNNIQILMAYQHFIERVKMIGVLWVTLIVFAGIFTAIGLGGGFKKPKVKTNG